MEEQGRYEIQPVSKGEVVNIEEYAMSLEGLLSQVRLIQNVMQKVMKEDEHYGIIPGTNKPTLLKPGAEKLCLTFRLDPDYDIIREVRERDFIAYTVLCRLRHIPTGQQVATGIGSCNSRETKYRYRSENTGKPVPKEYWDTRDPSILGGPQYRPRKKDGKWVIFEQVENDNPWDLDNTIIKMACKRALVAATLNATAASDIFTQDVEDMPPEIIGGADKPIAPKTKQEAPKKETSSKKAPAQKEKRDPNAKTNNYDFLEAIKALKKQLGDDEKYYALLGIHGYEHSNQITNRDHQVAFYRDLEIEISRMEKAAKEGI